MKHNLKMSYLLLTMFFTFLGSVAFGQQYIIKGKVINHNKQPIDNVYASLLKNDTVVAQIPSDSLGGFTINIVRGNYRLILEQFGTEYFNKTLELNQDLDLGEIEIKESVVLEGVTITARKKIVERKVDRMVFNVESSIASQGMSTLDALRNTPLVRIQNDNISIVGKSGVSIMINDKIVNLSGIELINYIQSLRSDNISKIEVITTPPAKYEAQGNSGIINIILKKKSRFGLERKSFDKLCKKIRRWIF